MTTLSILCRRFGWQGGTIHQARDEFLKSDPELADAICSELADKISDIDDPREALWFMKARNESVGLIVQSAGPGAA